MTRLIVRDARAEDATDIARLSTQLGYPADAASIPARLIHLASNGDDRTLIAQHGDSIIGVETVHVRFTLNHDAPLGQITMLVIDEDHRGTGAGRALVDAAEAWVRERGCDRIVVNTALHRAGAHAFYEKLGFTHGGRRYGKELSHHHE
jgi:GNAT superfamily N-acetyltransferase